MTLSNELAPSAFHTYRERQITPFYSPEIEDWFYPNSEDVRVEVTESGWTPLITNVSALTVLPIPRDFKTSGVLLKSPLLVQLRRTQEGVFAETWLEGVYEYGAGQDDTQAITDLVVSLGEYLSMLNRRKKQLGDSALKELKALRRLIEHLKPGT